MDHKDKPTADNIGYTPRQNDYPSFTDFKGENPINWNKYIFLFLRGWYWFMITIGIALAIVFFKIKYELPLYQASATIIIQDEENSQDVLGELRSVRYWRRQVDMANEIAKLNSYSIIKRAVDSLQQETFWTAHGRIRTRPLYNCPRYQLTILHDSLNWLNEKEWFIDYIDNKTFRFYREETIDTILQVDSQITLNETKFYIYLLKSGGHLTYSFMVNDPVKLAKRYRNKLKVELNELEGTILKLVSEGPVGEREVDFINTLCQIYILSELERKQQIAENTFGFIDEQINVILDSLNQAENQLLTYRLTNNVINLSREGEIAYERIKSFQDHRTQLKLKENYYAYLKKYIDERTDPKTIIAPTLLDAHDQVLIDAVIDLQNLYKQRENMDFTAVQNNPGLENINQRIKGVRLRILEILNGLIYNNKLTQEQLDTEENAVMKQLKTLPISEQQLLNIKRKYDLYNQFYTYLLQKRAETGIQKASVVSDARVLDPARYDDLISLGIRKINLILIAIALGIFIPAGIIVLIELLNNKIRELDDIISHSDIPIIGTIRHSSQIDSVPVIKDTKSSFSESFRRIRTNLAFALKDKDSKMIMVTSSVSGEGKTFTAANLAAIIAMNNQKVLLVGLDLRKPSLHRIFNVPNINGITSYLIGDKLIEEVIFPTNISNLFLLPSGPIPPNPAELIETDEMKRLMNRIRDDFDYIIIDTPPVAMVTDAIITSNYVDITLYLVRQNYSHKSTIEIMNSVHKDENLPKTYLLINDISPTKSMGVYYYYGYGKGYNYGYYGNKYSDSTNID